MTGDQQIAYDRLVYLAAAVKAGKYGEDEYFEAEDLQEELYMDQWDDPI